MIGRSTHGDGAEPASEPDANADAGTAAGADSAAGVGPVPFARHGRQRSTGPARTLVTGLGLGLAVLLVSSLAVVGIAVSDVATSLKPGIVLPGDTVSAGGPAPQIGAIDGGVNLLLVGSDSGEGDPAYGPRGEHLGDVTALLHISNDHTRASIVSFPRDLFVTIPACAASPTESAPGTDGGFTDKLNTALADGGLGCTVATITKLTGQNIPFAAEIEFNGVIAMSDAVGGVPVCVAEPIQDAYTGTFLSAGEHVLSGGDALQFLRTRHGLSTGSDLARIGNQQAFLASLVRTITSNGVLNNPLTLYSLAKAASSNMRLSTSLQHVDTLVSIALALRGMDLAQISFLQYPVDEVDGGLVARTADAMVLFTALAADAPVQVGGQLGPASEAAPGAPSAPPVASVAPVPSAGPAATGAPSSVPTALPGPVAVTLPPSITGQTAAEQTCAVGRTLVNQ